MVRLESVRKSFGDLVVLDGIDLEVSPGEVLVVIGPSGSGKSTLLRCVNLLEPVDSGRIFLEGREITGKGVHVSQVRQRVGIVDVRLHQREARQHEQVAMPRAAARGNAHRVSVLEQARAQVTTDEAGAAQHADGRPAGAQIDGVDHAVSSRRPRLSGNREQQLAVAATDPQQE